MALSRTASRSRSLVEHDLFGKPVSTFPDHGLEFRAMMRGAYDPRSRTMAVSYSRRNIVVAACSAGLMVLLRPAEAAPLAFKVGYERRTAGAAGANRRQRHG